MRFTLVRSLAIAGVAALALAACGSSSKSSSSTNTTAPAAIATTTTPATTASSGGDTVELTTATVKDFGSQKILADGKGMTLYISDKDTAGKSNCTGVCAENWPTVPVTGTPVIGPGLTASKFTAITGPDGNKILAVNGKPLYTWKADTSAGMTTGQGVNGFYVVNAQGTKLDKD
jgi:predicted lipoprotein with Yx(FWY)xxD motif